MDAFTTLYERLRERARLAQSRQSRDSVQKLPTEPPALEDWLRYWNDGDTDLSNLRNLDHWLSRTRRERKKVA
jgi:hypothetical protein